MTTFGISLMKNETDICYWTVQHMLTQVDHVMVLDNNSTDNTKSLLLSLGVDVIDDLEKAHYQSRKVTWLAHRAHEQGADWIIPFDADEIWYSPFYPRIADYLETLGPQWLAASATLYNHFPTGNDDPSIVETTKRIGWRKREPGALKKVACRWREDMIIQEGNHSAYYEGGTTIAHDNLVIRHFPYRSAEQFIKKARNGAAALALTDLDFSIGQHWREYGNLINTLGEQVLADVFFEHFYSEHPEEDDSFIYDPAPVEE